MSQYDIHLVLAIEKVTGVKLVQLPGVDEEAVLAAMGKVTTARQMAKLRLAETGFEQKIADDKARKQEQRQEQVGLPRTGPVRRVRADVDEDMFPRLLCSRLMACAPGAHINDAVFVPCVVCGSCGGVDLSVGVP